MTGGDSDGSKGCERIVDEHGPAIREMAREDTPMAPVASAVLRAAGEEVPSR